MLSMSDLEKGEREFDFVRKPKAGSSGKAGSTSNMWEYAVTGQRLAIGRRDNGIIWN